MRAVAGRTVRASVVFCAVTAWGVFAILSGCSSSPVEAPPAESVLPVKQAVANFGPYDLLPATLEQMPAGIYKMSFPEPIWLVGYKTEIVDEQGNVLPKELHCHTMFKTVYMDEWVKHHGRPFKGLFSDGGTSELHVPEGFGIYYDTGEPVEVIPMFNNRHKEVVRAGMRSTIDYIKAEELDEPLTPLYSMIQSVVKPHLYLVDPGEDVKERVFKFPFTGTIHMMGVHIHPYGRSMELINETRGESVWKSVAELTDEGTVDNMPVYSDTTGYPINMDDSYRIRAIYGNPTNVKQDAMAGLVVLFSTDDGKMPLPTTAGDPDVEHADHGGH